MGFYDGIFQLICKIRSQVNKTWGYLAICALRKKNCFKIHIFSMGVCKYLNLQQTLFYSKWETPLEKSQGDPWLPAFDITAAALYIQHLYFLTIRNEIASTKRCLKGYTKKAEKKFWCTDLIHDLKKKSWQHNLQEALSTKHTKSKQVYACKMMK